jgi:hypothetical protein
LNQQQGKSDNDHDGRAGWRPQRESQLSIGEAQVEEGVEQSNRKEDTNQQAIERARLEPSDPAPPARARFHGYKRNDVPLAKNPPWE